MASEGKTLEVACRLVVEAAHLLFVVQVVNFAISRATIAGGFRRLLVTVLLVTN